MNLDKLLKKVEKNSLNAEQQKTQPLKIAGETFDVLTMTRKEKADFIYSRPASTKTSTVGEIVKWAKPYIYKALQLNDLAVKAVEAKYIKTYYDVVDYLFEPEEILEIIAFLGDINKIGEVANEEIEDIKKS